MKQVEQIVGLPVLTVDRGLRLGRVRGVVIDAPAGQIRYLEIHGESGHPGGFIPWTAIQAVGDDAVTVPSAGVVEPRLPEAELESLTDQLGDRPVMTESGKELGRITSYDLDERAGRIERYHVTSGGLLGRLTGRSVEFPHSAVRTFGKEAIIVVADAGGRSSTQA